MDLNELRNKIDTVDAEIARLLNERHRPPRRKKTVKDFLRTGFFFFRFRLRLPCQLCGFDTV